MKLSEAMNIINQDRPATNYLETERSSTCSAMNIINQDRPATGFRVHFTTLRGSILATNYFPDSPEPPLATEEEAWNLARKFANKHGNVFNVYVVDQHWHPVTGYAKLMLKKR